MKRLLILGVCFVLLISCEDKVYIPDNNFEQALIDLGYDDAIDGYVLKNSINNCKELDVSFKGISYLNGIQEFSALTELSCINNQLTSLDLRGNTALTRLSCYSNKLTSLNVSGCTALTYLNCGDFGLGNGLTSLDITQNTALTELYCNNNQLTSLDVSQNTALTNLNCSNNQLTSLNVSGCTALVKLYCNRNQLTGWLDLSQNAALIDLDCEYNQLTSLGELGPHIDYDILNCWNNNFNCEDYKGKP